MEEEKKEKAWQGRICRIVKTSALVSRVQKFAEVVAEAINTHVLYIYSGGEDDDEDDDDFRHLLHNIKGALKWRGDALLATEMPVLSKSLVGQTLLVIQPAPDKYQLFKVSKLLSGRKYNFSLQFLIGDDAGKEQDNHLSQDNFSSTPDCVSEWAHVIESTDA